MQQDLLDADDPLGLGTTYASRLADWRMKNNYVTRGVDTYWLSKPLRTGVNHNHSLNINGGWRRFVCVEFTLWNG